MSLHQISQISGQAQSVPGAGAGAPAAPPNANAPMQAALNAYQLNMNAQAAADDDESDIDDSEDMSAIQINIRSPLIITGNNNMIACDSSATASAIAQGVVTALKQMSMGQHGIPMIDENGRPRPLFVSVEAEVRVEGSCNIFGERAVLSRMIEMKKAKPAATVTSHQVGVKKAGAAVNGSANGKRHRESTAAANGLGGLGIVLENGVENKKRERSNSVEAADSKRTRHD